MGVAIEKLILDQLKKGQGETNDRIDRLTELLERLVVQTSPSTTSSADR